MSNPTIFRSSTKGCFRLLTTPYGSYLAPARDPLADGDLPDNALKEFELDENPPQIPAELWSAWIRLCFHFVENGNGVEVGCRILRNSTDHDQWRILIPEQRVCGASVHVKTCDGAIDLITGEIVAQYPPEGWDPMGTSHSHNTMDAFFSGTDDSTELGDPGMHVVVGSIDTKTMRYSLKASITAHLKRYIIDHSKVIDVAPIRGVFHPDVLLHVDSTPMTPAWGTTKQSAFKTTKFFNNESQRWETIPTDMQTRGHALPPSKSVYSWDYVDAQEVKMDVDERVRSLLERLCDLHEYIINTPEEMEIMERALARAEAEILSHVGYYATAEGQPEAPMTWGSDVYGYDDDFLP